MSLHSAELLAGIALPALVLAEILLISRGGRGCAIAVGCISTVPVAAFVVLLIITGNPWYVWLGWLLFGVLAVGLLVGCTLRLWKPRRLIAWLACLVLSAGIIAGGHLYERSLKDAAAARMLAAVGIEKRPDITVVYSGSWTDPLKYKDGYEIVHVLMDKDSETALSEIIPESWTWESMPVSDLSRLLHIEVDTEAVWKDSMGGDRCDAWFLADRRTGGLPFEEQDFCLGYYEEGHNIIHIYRGHHLYGLN